MAARPCSRVTDGAKPRSACAKVVSAYVSRMSPFCGGCRSMSRARPDTRPMSSKTSSSVTPGHAWRGWQLGLPAGPGTGAHRHTLLMDRDPADSPADELAALVEMARRIQSAMIERGLTLATAESCTGGLIGHVLTEVSGSSDYYVGGLISYSNELKERELGVDAATLETHGAVSAQTCVAMAEGARSAVRRVARRGGHGHCRSRRRHGPEAGRPDLRGRRRRGRPRRPPLRLERRSALEQAAERRRQRLSCSWSASRSPETAREPHSGRHRGGLAPARAGAAHPRRASASTSLARQEPARPQLRCWPITPARSSPAATRARRRRTRQRCPPRRSRSPRSTPRTTSRPASVAQGRRAAWR